MAQGGIFPSVVLSLYVNDMPLPSRHVDLALYAGNTTVIATSRLPALLVKYLETYLSVRERWLRERRFTLIVSKSTAVFFAKADRRIQTLRPVELFGEPIHWVRKKAAQRLGMVGPLLNRRSGHPSGMEFSCISNSYVL